MIGDLAAGHGLAIYEMTPLRASLEDAFMALTRDAVEFDAQDVSQ
jgi:ABC-2 type transport system ATP-binding protein